MVIIPDRKKLCGKTDEKVLKFLSEQKLHIGTQLKWITKLIQYDFTIEYKKGRGNKVADALSRMHMIELSIVTLSTMKTELLNLIVQSWNQDSELAELIKRLKEGDREANGYTWIHDQLRKKGKLVVGADP